MNAHETNGRDRTARKILFLFAIAAFCALIFLALHLPYLPGSLEDVDSINFALGMRKFDVPHHQPHPPGYPVFVLAANGMHAIVHSEPRALAAVGVLAASLGIVAMFALFRRLVEPGSALLGALLAATTPLYWFTAVRPLSDTVGLAAALALQALILSVRSDGALIAVALLSGVAAGIRSQVVWLTVPLLAARLGGLKPCAASGFTVTPAEHDEKRVPVSRIGAAAGAFAGGILLWFVPLVFLSGGPATYWHALFDQGAEDLSGITMLWTRPTIRTFVDALYYAFVAPWAVWHLAVVVLLLAAAGVFVLLRRDWRALAIVVTAFGPYLVFDILFQETFTVRYALPVVVPVALFAAAALGRAPRFGALAVAVPVVMYGSHIGGRSIAAYSREAAPVFRLLNDMRAAAHDSTVAPVLAPDRRASFDLRRPMVWLGSDAPSFDRQLAAPPQHEWLEAVRYWNSGGRRPVWFVVDPRRAAIDFVQHRQPYSYKWSVPYPTLLSGTRPNDADWYRVEQPDWYVGEGWSLTPEAAGISAVDHRGLNHATIEGRVAARAASGAVLVFGGRNFEASVLPQVTISIGSLWRQTLTVGPGDFLQIIRLPQYRAGAGVGDYLPLKVSADPPSNVGIEQFDVAPPSRPTGGFGAGWYEHELNPVTGAQWRWLSDSGEFRYVAPAGGILVITGESPAKYYSRPSRMTIRAGKTVLRETSLSTDFTVEVPVPPAPEPAAITLETDQIHVPADRSWRGSADRRRLGLRIYSCVVRPVTVSVPGTGASSPPAR